MLLPEHSPVGRDDLMRLFAEAGVSVRRGIMAAHLEPAYASAKRPSLPVTERLTAHSLILPLFHQMTEPQQDHVVSVLTSALASSTPTMSVP
jgi:perosamine synthetase